MTLTLPSTTSGSSNRARCTFTAPFTLSLTPHSLAAPLSGVILGTFRSDHHKETSKSSFRISVAMRANFRRPVAQICIPPAPSDQCAPQTPALVIANYKLSMDMNDQTRKPKPQSRITEDYPDAIKSTSLSRPTGRARSPEVSAPSSSQSTGNQLGDKGSLHTKRDQPTQQPVAKCRPWCADAPQIPQL